MPLIIIYRNKYFANTCYPLLRATLWRNGISTKIVEKTLIFDAQALKPESIAHTM